jgi:putative heme-binding domain-containing protein
MWSQLNPDIQRSAVQALTSRAAWAVKLVTAVGEGRIPKEAVSADALRQMGSLKDAGVEKVAEKVFGKLQPSDDKAKLATLNRVKLLLRPSGVIGRTTQGDAASGKAVFAGLCGKCHRLNGEGASIGPDLTGINRTSLDDLLMNVVFPSAFIRPEFASVEVTTRDGESVGGLLAENTENNVVVLDAAGQKHSFARGSVKEIKDSKLSLMPEGLLEALKDQEIQDLFAYLQADAASAK